MMNVLVNKNNKIYYVCSTAHVGWKSMEQMGYRVVSKLIEIYH